MPRSSSVYGQLRGSELTFPRIMQPVERDTAGTSGASSKENSDSRGTKRKVRIVFCLSIARCYFLLFC
jgi:hypothetical protein